MHTIFQNEWAYAAVGNKLFGVSTVNINPREWNPLAVTWPIGQSIPDFLRCQWNFHVNFEDNSGISSDHEHTLLAY
jgi:hypothetical protein